MTTEQIALTHKASLVLQIFEDLETIKTQTTLTKAQVFVFIAALKQLDTEDFAGLGKSIAIESGLASSKDTYATLVKLGKDWTLKKCEAFLQALKANVPNGYIH